MASLNNTKSKRSEARRFRSSHAFQAQTHTVWRYLSGSTPELEQHEAADILINRATLQIHEADSSHVLLMMLI